MTPPEQLWTLEHTLAFIADYFGSDAEIAKRYAVVVASEIVYDYEAERAAHLARIAELETKLTEAKIEVSNAESAADMLFDLMIGEDDEEAQP